MAASPPPAYFLGVVALAGSYLLRAWPPLGGGCALVAVLAFVSAVLRIRGQP